MKFRDYSKLTPEETVRDINAAWDRIKALAATNDRQQQEIQALKEKLSTANLKLWVMTGALFGLWEVIKFLILHH